MSANDDNSQGKKTLSLKGGTLGLKKSVDLNKVEQKFSHGRTKAVSVERKGAAAPRPQARGAETARPNTDSLRRRDGSGGGGRPADAGNAAVS